MKSKKITFTEVPLIATLGLASLLEILKFEDGSIEVSAGGAHLGTWTKEEGWKTGKELPATKRD
jgi:hypothetical protein